MTEDSCEDSSPKQSMPGALERFVPPAVLAAVILIIVFRQQHEQLRASWVRLAVRLRPPAAPPRTHWTSTELGVFPYHIPGEVRDHAAAVGAASVRLPPTCGLACVEPARHSCPDLCGGNSGARFIGGKDRTGIAAAQLRSLLSLVPMLLHMISLPAM